ncbi:hypothetical protein, partial [Thermogemmatispora sp.]|uniref:hypothetical protein n=1 Tax=Thermogemmatispora sp. TaxID=1968838 RepID=UPI0035E413F1
MQEASDADDEGVRKERLHVERPHAGPHVRGPACVDADAARRDPSGTRSLRGGSRSALLLP